MVADGCRSRLRMQHLAGPGARSAADVLRALGVVQAQDYAGAKWAIGQRVKGATDAGIEADMAAGRILRTHVLRPTWHFVRPEDIRWMLALTAPRIAAILASYNRTLELTPEVLRRSNDVIVAALEGGRQLTRPELRDALARAGIRAATQRLSRIVMQAEIDALICSGPRRGNAFTYALLDERAPAVAPRDRDESLGDLATRYFRTRGPASLHDFAWWSGLSMLDSKRAVEIAGPALRRVEQDGVNRWRGRTPVPKSTRTTAHLLPNYDEYFIGLKDRTALGMRGGGAGLVVGGSAPPHVAFVDGQLVGAWRRIQGGGRLSVDLRLTTRLTAAERALLEAEAARLGRFLELPHEFRCQSIGSRRGSR